MSAGALIEGVFSLSSGTIGFFACFWFVTKIYSVVKVDWGIQINNRLYMAGRCFLSSTSGTFSSVKLNWTLQPEHSPPHFISSSGDDSASDRWQFSLLCVPKMFVCEHVCIGLWFLYIQYLHIIWMKWIIPVPALPSIWHIERWFIPCHLHPVQWATAGLLSDSVSRHLMHFRFVLWSLHFMFADVVRQIKLWWSAS